MTPTDSVQHSTLVVANDTLWPMQNTEHLTRSQVARKLGISGEYVRALALSGRIDYQETPLGRLYLAASVEAYAKRRQLLQRRAES